MAENQTNQYQRTTVTTNMLNMWDQAGNQLRLAGNGSGLQIAIWQPVIGPDGSRKYPAEQRVSCLLSPRNVAAMDKIIYEYLVPEYTKGKDAKYSLFTNAVRSTVAEVECINSDLYFNLYLDCDPTTRVSNRKFTFKFDTVPIIDKYDQNTGDMDVTVVQADFLIFSKAIRAYNDLAGGLIPGHGVRSAMMYQNNAFMDYLRSIATAIGAQLPAPMYQRTAGSYQSQQNQNGISSTVEQSSYQQVEQVPAVHMNQVTNIEDML